MLGQILLDPLLNIKLCSFLQVSLIINLSDSMCVGDSLGRVLDIKELCNGKLGCCIVLGLLYVFYYSLF